MQQTVKAKAVHLLPEKLKRKMLLMRAAMNESEHYDKLSDFLYKTSNNTCRDSATKIFESFVDQKPKRQISSSSVKLSKWCAEKSLYLI